MMCVFVLLFLSGSVPVNSLFAVESDTFQRDLVTGVVKDASTGEALTGVTVMIKGTTLGTLTDINDQF